MGNEVFANGREIACKSGSGKVIAAFPDVCFTPPDKVPPTPPGVPIPYPLTSMASDTDKGTKKVMISNKEVMKRDSSNFKKCAGDDAAQTAKKGMISSKLTGKVFFNSWSMDVKIEGKNVVRHLDITTSNHSSPNANAAVPQIFQDTNSTPSQIDPCASAANSADQADEFGPKKAKRTKDDGETVEYDTVPAGGLFVPSAGIPALPGVPQSGVRMMSHSSISARDIRPGTARGSMSGGQGGNIVCPGKKLPVRKAGHAEVKILEDILVGRYPGTLTRSAYKPKGTLYLTVKRKDVCCSCQKAIKCAEQQGIKVVYCNDNEGNPTRNDPDC